jgi:hypothetical protein
MLIRVKLKSQPDLDFARIDEADYNEALHERLDPLERKQPPAHRSGTPDLVAVVLLNEDGTEVKGAPVPVIIEADTLDPRWHKLWGDGTPPKPPEPPVEVDPVQAQIAELSDRVAALETGKKGSHVER